MMRCWIKIAAPSGMVRTSAFDAGDGLAIHRTLGNLGFMEEGWTVTHIPTGLAIRQCVPRPLAEAIVEAIRPLCDWPSVTGTKPPKAKAIRDAMEAAEEAYDEEAEAHTR